MKAINERLQRIQEEQAARQEDRERGRLRVVEPRPQEKPADQSQQQPKKAAG